MPSVILVAVLVTNIWRYRKLIIVVLGVIVVATVVLLKWAYVPKPKNVGRCSGVDLVVRLGGQVGPEEIIPKFRFFLESRT